MNPSTPAQSVQVLSWSFSLPKNVLADSAVQIEMLSALAGQLLLNQEAGAAVVRFSCNSPKQECSACIPET
jgi:hypothetical protein